MKLLTIVIPAYNAEKYINFCVSSMYDPDFSDSLEIIIVDDGSNDRTGELSDTLMQKYPEVIRVIHKENGGHGSGINAGINAAAGLYFKVVDADDWVDKNVLRRLLNYISAQSMNENKPDIIWNNYYWRKEKEDCSPDEYPKAAEFKEPFKGVSYGAVYNFEDVATKCYIKMHNMTIRTNILRENGIVIDEHCFYVDVEYTLFPIPYIKRIVFLPDYLYQYRIGRSGQSMEPAKMIKNVAQYDHVLKKCLDYYRKQVENNKNLGSSKIYMENLLARVYAGRVKILLTMPDAKHRKKEFLNMEKELKNKYPEVYDHNINSAIVLLRRSRYTLYSAAVAAMKVYRKIRA